MSEYEKLWLLLLLFFICLRELARVIVCLRGSVPKRAEEEEREREAEDPEWEREREVNEREFLRGEAGLVGLDLWSCSVVLG